MTRIVLARQARGVLVEKVQQGVGLTGRDVDGDYGGQTEDAVKDFQSRSALPVSGITDIDTWSLATGLPMPELFQRALGITAVFEGHGFDLAQGNFDGAGITWGIIGFTLRHGEIPKIVLEMEATRPDLVRLAFAENRDQLLEVMRAPIASQIAFADAVSIGSKKVKLAEPWLSSFGLFGRLAEVQAVQMDRARNQYFKPALATARRLGLKTELGVALAFDIQVQNGGVKKAIADDLLSREFPDEGSLRVALANAVADASAAKFQEDVRSRKLTLATGSGTVHAAAFTARSWGLDELPA